MLNWQHRLGGFQQGWNMRFLQQLSSHFSWCVICIQEAEDEGIRKAIFTIYISKYPRNQELLYLYSVHKNLLEVAAACSSQDAPHCERVCVVSFLYPKVDITLPKVLIGRVIIPLQSWGSFEKLKKERKNARRGSTRHSACLQRPPSCHSKTKQTSPPLRRQLVSFICCYPFDWVQCWNDGQINI